MKVLVTGACGWIGRHLSQGLTDHGHAVDCYDLVYPDGGPCWVGDVRDRGQVEEALEKCRPDAVLHLAARYGRVWCETYKAHAFDVNVTGTATVAEACEEAGLPLILTSSSEVYGTRPGAPRAVRTAEELAALAPLNTYGDSKLMAEKAAHRIVDPTRLAIWRLNMPYGPGGRPGDSGVPGFGYNALHTWIWQAAHGLDLTVYRGTSRSWTWIGDVVDAMVFLLEAGHRGTINVCSSRDMQTSRQTAETVIACTGSPSRIVEVDPPAGVTPWKQLDDSALYALGWAPVVDLPEGIGRKIGYMRRFDVKGGMVWVRKRLRPAHGREVLDGLYGQSDRPLGHADHRLRIPLTAKIGRWLVAEHQLTTLADLSCGYEALMARAVAHSLIPFGSVVVGDYGTVAAQVAAHGALTGPIEETIHRIDPVDLFVCAETIEHLDDPDDALSQVRQKTRFLLLSTPVGSWDDPTPGHYWAWDREEVEKMLKRAGFAPVVYSELDFAAPDLFQTFGIWGAR